MSNLSPSGVTESREALYLGQPERVVLAGISCKSVKNKAHSQQQRCQSFTCSTKRPLSSLALLLFIAKAVKASVCSKVCFACRSRSHTMAIISNRCIFIEKRTVAEHMFALAAFQLQAQQTGISRVEDDVQNSSRRVVSSEGVCGLLHFSFSPNLSPFIASELHLKEAQ